MNPFPEIVVGLDLEATGRTLSRGSRRALEQALWLVEHGSRGVTLLHSTAGDRYLEPVAGRCAVVHVGVPEEGHAAFEEARERVERAGATARLLVSEQKPWIAMIEEVHRRPGALAIVGRHEAREDGPAIGHVALRLLRKSPGPVWVALPDSQPAPERVLAATDLGAVGASAIETAARVAQLAGGAVSVVHAYQIPMGAEWSRDPAELPDPKRMHADALAAVRAQVAEHAGAMDVHVDVGCTTPVRGILEALRARHPDLLVMGTVSRGGVPGFLIGNTAERVLPRSSCSLLVVKPADFITPIPPARG